MTSQRPGMISPNPFQTSMVNWNSISDGMWRSTDASYNTYDTIFHP